VELAPENGNTHSALGAALVSQGQLERARKHLRTALRYRPGFSEDERGWREEVERNLSAVQGSMVERK
jgi:uncharacterized protein HemY